MKYEWRKNDKELYLTSQQPTLLTLPKMTYLTLKGEGNPNGEDFSKRIQALYSYSYNIKMSPRKGIETAGYYDYTVFPLEAFWDSKVVVIPGEPLDKEQLTYELMIRQPDFVTTELLSQVKANVAKKVAPELLEEVQLQEITEGKNLQLLHLGSYDDEPASFAEMAVYCQTENLERLGHRHKEIYLSDPRRTEPSKLKTLLRFPVK
ncbi:GyrI-like domain-containing protein [Vagococcus salmoninarum]|uniref:GyrI-like domain-containing protein n=1 Tax=Vagococcus salmoninarum TaxID=2739 RepID=UPI003F9C4D96